MKVVAEVEVRNPINGFWTKLEEEWFDGTLENAISYFQTKYQSYDADINIFTEEDDFLKEINIREGTFSNLSKSK